MKTLENKFCKINYLKSLLEIANDTILVLNEETTEYKNIFGYLDDNKIIVNYFDEIDNFRNFIHKIRGENYSLTDYAYGTYDDGMLNAYIEPISQRERKYTVGHELFHILYMKYV